MSLVRSLLDEDYWPLSRRRAAGDSWDDWPLMTPLSFNFPMRNFYRGTPTALSRYLADEFRQMQV